jgi:hypothetical protein
VCQRARCHGVDTQRELTHSVEMLVKRNISCSKDMVLPTTHCCASRASRASTAWPIILLVLTATALIVRTVAFESETEPPALESAPPCVDRAFHCHEWAAKGECRTNPSFMATTCPASCHLCSDVVLVRRDGVDSPVSKSAAGVEAPTVAATAAAAAAGTAAAAAATKPAAAAATADAASGVKIRYFSGGVEVPALAGRASEKPVERPLSAAQQQQGSGSCEDTHTRCEAWSLAGECEKNPSFMHRSCRSSCGLCSLRPQVISPPQHLR